MAAKVISVALLMLSFAPIGDTSECVPSNRAFTYSPTCKEYHNLPIKIYKIVAKQGKPLLPVESRGGCDLTKPLQLLFNISQYTGKPIKNHKMKLRMFQYIKQNGECNWVEMDLADMVEEQSMCPVYENVPCDYHTHPSYIVSKIDFSYLFGQGVRTLTPGLIEKDGSKVLSCCHLQSKVTKVE